MNRPKWQRLLLVYGIFFVSQLAVTGGDAKPREEEFLVRLREGVYGYLPSRVTEEELLRYYNAKTSEEGLALDKAIQYRQIHLDLLLNFDPRGAELNMPRDYPVIETRSPRLLTLSPNWQWIEATGGEERLVHTSADDNPHSASGVSQYLIPPGAVLVQRVFLDPDQPPTEVSVSFIVPVAGYAGIFDNRTCRARWGGQPIRIRTDNAPFDFYAGPLPGKGRWAALELPAMSIGLGGPRPLFFGVSFHAVGGKALFGPTRFLRAPLEICPAKPLGIYYWDEKPGLVARINNPGQTPETCRLSCQVHDFREDCVHSTEQEVSVPAAATEAVPLTIPEAVYLRSGPLGHKAAPLRCYFTVHAALTRPGFSASAHTSLGLILPNRTGRNPDSPFGAMLWDRPASKLGATFYRDAGMKLFSTTVGRVGDGEGPLLSLYTAHDMFLHAHIWDLAFLSAEDARSYQGKDNPLVPRLSQPASVLRLKGGRFVSNFWEVDLRTLPETYGLNAKPFRDAIRQGNPEALVGTGGLAGTNIAYVDQMMKAGGAGNIDFVICMAYLTPSPPERSGVPAEVRALREVFQRHGVPDVNLWFSEWSYFDHLNIERPELSAQWLNSGVSRDLISPYMVREALTLLAAGAAKILPNAPFQFSSRPLSQTYGHTMTGCSSHRHDYSPLPMCFAWSVLTRHLEGKTCKGLIDCGPGVHCVRFDSLKESYKGLRSTPSVLALWSEYGTKTVGLDVSQRSVEVMNFVGDARTFHTADGRLTLTASARPQYVLLDSSEQVRPTEPLVTPLKLRHDAVFGEPAGITAEFRVTNPMGTRLSAFLAFDGPTWCSAEPRQVKMDLGSNESQMARFVVSVPKENQDRIHYEFADIVPRAEHTIGVCLLDRRDRRLAEARAALAVHEPLEVRLRPLLAKRADQEEPKLLVRIRNHSGRAKAGSVEIRTKARLDITPGAQRFSVEAGEQTTATFQVRGALPGPDKPESRKTPDKGERVRLGGYDPNASGYCYSFGIGEGYVVEAVVKCDDETGGDENRQSRGLAFLPCVRAKEPPKLDGREDDWSEAVWFDVGPAGRINSLPFFCNVHSHEKENVGMYFKGPVDLSARWAARWDETCLYLFFRVLDDVFHQPYGGDMLWNGDSVRFTVDPTPDETDAGIQPVPRDPASFQAFDVGLSPAGPQLYRNYDACGLRPGPVASAKVSVARRPDGVSYELAVPWEEIGRVRPEPGGWVQMSIVFDDSDGHGRKTWINWFGGLGGIAREPRLMGDLNFVE